MKFPFEAPVQPVVPVAGSLETFPVHRIYCVGRNYADHAREMGSDPDREPPFFFTKPADAVVVCNDDDDDKPTPVPYPPATSNLHHEIELVVAIATSNSGKEGVAVDTALEHVFGYALGVDLTRRDLQAQAKEARRPWDMAKGFDASAPISAIHPVMAEAFHERMAKSDLWLQVNGETRQSGNVSHMIWSVAEIVASLSQYVQLQSGDLIFTGTPSGVGPLERGQLVTAGGLDGLGKLQFTVV